MFRSRRIAARLLPAVLAGVVVHFLASASSAGEIAKYETRRLVLHTDVKPATARMLVQAFDAAWKTWVAEFGLPPDDRDGQPLRMTSRPPGCCRGRSRNSWRAIIRESTSVTGSG